MSEYLRTAQRTFAIELSALQKTCAALEERSFAHACELLLRASGRVVVTGIGKSGHVARKIASTLSSTGTPAMFMHPAEAAHGDMGMLKVGDVVLVLSKSGESEELSQILPAVTAIGVPIVAITANATSHLARTATSNGGEVLLIQLDEEACPHDLAPTASTTAALALGDAIAMALLEARQFTSEDFARLHPAGALGRKLTYLVKDLMAGAEATPKVLLGDDLSTVMLEISEKRLGAACVVSDKNELLGIVTDGDLRRYFQTREHVSTTKVCARDIMSASPRTITPTALAFDALRLMEEGNAKVMQLIVVDDDEQVCGMIHMHEIVRAGIS